MGEKFVGEPPSSMSKQTTYPILFCEDLVFVDVQMFDNDKFVSLDYTAVIFHYWILET